MPQGDCWGSAYGKMGEWDRERERIASAAVQLCMDEGDVITWIRGGIRLGWNGIGRMFGMERALKYAPASEGNLMKGARAMAGDNADLADFLMEILHCCVGMARKADALRHRHLVISDLHENCRALEHFVRMAERSQGGLDDIWLLGDLFGHSDSATGNEDLTQDVIDAIRGFERYRGPVVCGNWEYWLTHPESDAHNSKYREQLAQRRELLGRRSNRPLLDWIARDTTRCIGDFTLFHGCSYACFRNSDFQPHPCETYLFPRDLNIVTRGLFGNADHLKTPHFLFGHTHTPGFFTYSVSSMVNMWRFFTMDLVNRPICYGDSGLRFGINPGSAGISSRRFPRTAILLDTAEKTFTYLVDIEE